MRSTFFIFFLLFVLSSLLDLASAHYSLTPWRTFLNLTDVRHGDAHPALPDLKKYLHHFGYLSSDSASETFGDDLESAVRTYQRNFNLKVTGVLDRSTVAQLMEPRCGIPDIVDGATSTSAGKIFRARGLYGYFEGRPKWPANRRRLTYALTATSAVSIDRSVLSSVFSRAFDRWAAVTDFRFTEVSSNDSDITVGFYEGWHGDRHPFDGRGGVLAHATHPTGGRFHLDAAEDWFAQGDVTKASSRSAMDLESVAVHEIGHLLGLAHSTVRQAIMWPTIGPRTRKVALANDDVQGIQNLYGIS